MPPIQVHSGAGETPVPIGVPLPPQMSPPAASGDVAGISLRGGERMQPLFISPADREGSEVSMASMTPSEREEQVCSIGFAAADEGGEGGNLQHWEFI